ncbi:Putative von Willebrand factor A [Corynebacterium glyciniphilum AJ 3170]|uniref:Putative von Willebrand factor A n=1 Tax=Corynebacterium glyciniphilum AJ 3170 TaxID=1404245 RepID=X5DQH8_9CORY|nr:VWA domain-containing protein [Corynebacterium glyciniphilum]AHW63539.1 Putative von Willebrand factor A [Corynebacterium glyciniphilum AJ 3170]
MANRRLTRQARFGRYTGGPDPLAPPVDLSAALDAIGEDVMAGDSAEHAVREFLRREGLDDIARRVAERRREATHGTSLDGTLREIRTLLDAAVLAERRQLARDITLDDTDRAFAEMRLENLPPSAAAAVSELNDYRWQSSEAQEAFDTIRDLLGREMLDQRFAGMKNALENATEEDRAATQEMLDDLNRLLDAHQRGSLSPREFDEFMDKHGAYFPENPRTVDELLDTLAQRSAAAQRMRNSMSQDQREELDDLAQQAFGSPRLLDSLRHLDGYLQVLRPEEDWSGRETMGEGESPEHAGLGDGTGVFQDIADLDRLVDQLSQSYADSSLGDVDLDVLQRLLGDEATAQVRSLQDLESALMTSGTLRRGQDGRLRLSPKAMRTLGQSLLRDAADRLSARRGQRDAHVGGAGGEVSGASRPWEFGDTAPWDVTRTVANAVRRTVTDGADASAGVRLEIDDIEVQDIEARTRACVALLVDTSFSMATEGRWVPMKRTALALHTLVTTRFRGDDLELITFGRRAQVTDIDQLTGLEAEWEQGTNLHHALLLAHRHFRRHPDARPVLLVVTDGEPTAHLESGGRAFFDYPPHPLTVANTVHELDAVARAGAQTTFFRLGDDPGLARFIGSVARRVGGAVVAPDLGDLGAAVVESYLGSRTRDRQRRRQGHRHGHR